MWCGGWPNGWLEESPFISSSLFLWKGLECIQCVTKGSLSFLSPSSFHTYRYRQQNSELRGCFGEHSTLSVSLELKSKPSTVDCTLWLTIICSVALRFCWRQKTKAGHTRTFSSPCRDYFSKGHNQHSLLSVGWAVWTSSLNNECNCGPAFCCHNQQHSTFERCTECTALHLHSSRLSESSGWFIQSISCDQISVRRALVQTRVMLLCTSMCYKWSTFL